jgi:predicted dehydrogenase
MTTEPLQVACVGIGRWAYIIAAAVARSDELKLVSCFTRSPEKRAAFAQMFGCGQAATYADLLADPQVEAVLITTPNAVHAESIVLAAAAGKHAWVEKPIADTLAHAQHVADAVRRAGVTISVGHSARRLGASRAMKALVEQGDLGDVMLVEANYCNQHALDLPPEKWRDYAANSPGGPLLRLLVHHFDTLQYILGPIVEVQAYKRRLHTAANVDDVATVLAQFAGGYLGYFGGSLSSPRTYSIRIYGTGANLYHEVDWNYWTSMDVDAHSTLFRQVHRSSEPIAVAIPRTDMFREELEDFADAIRSARAPEVGLEAGIRVLAVVEAAIRSAEERRPVGVAEIVS